MPDHKEEFHEERSEIQDFRDNMKDLWARFGNHVMTLLIVVLGFIAAKRWWNVWQYKQLENAHETLNNATSPVALLEVASESSRADIRPQALLRAGDLSLGFACSEPDADKRAKQLERAAQAYQLLSQDSLATDAYKVVAQIGLANVAESRLEWEAAEKYWDAAIAEATKAQLPNLLQKASVRKAALQKNQQPVKFGVELPPPPPAPEVGLPKVDVPEVLPATPIAPPESSDTTEVPATP